MSPFVTKFLKYFIKQVRTNGSLPARWPLRAGENFSLPDPPGDRSFKKMLETGAVEIESREQPEAVGAIPGGDLGGLNPGPLFAGALESLERAKSGGVRWVPLPLEEVQRELPQYTILGLLGRGGMGAVYQARQDNLDRLVAIKILPPGIDRDDLQFAERFKQEAKALAKFKHSGIVSVHDAGETPGGLLCIVMECIEGTDVGQLLARDGRIAPDEAIRITAKVCEALAYAHERGVVHRDIKPSNVMIEADGTVKVADFGLAKLTSQNGGGFTRSDVALGSPDFAAPECFLAGTQSDGRADIYSVGVMLYQMLTGVLPRGRFEPPSGVVRQLDKRLDVIVDRALQPDREKRYASVLELKVDVDRLIPGLSGALSVEKRRHFHTPLGIGLAVVLVLAAAVAIVRRPAETKPAKTPAVAAAAIKPKPLPQWQTIEFAKLDPPTPAAQLLPPLEGELMRIKDWIKWMVPASLDNPGPLRHRNIAIRTTYLVKGGPRPKLTLLLQRFPEIQYDLTVYGASLRLCCQIEQRPRQIRDYEKPRIPPEGAEVSFQLARIGQQFYVWFDGTLLGRVDDAAFDQGGEFGIQALDGCFRSFEYLPLDDVSEAEALKLIGIGKP